ncbi:tripartite motif-containing protein 16-like [Coregonus clupeaformis]|uniref:tripartite motif-containing protein 16-like n=1 Tax=Coregonus clupeaformis TaxID=59861 RepID=UPI001E1C95AB|nr:tripartite motif-containing protein 16-like [Coregonus clupeaformis]
MQDIMRNREHARYYGGTVSMPDIVEEPRSYLEQTSSFGSNLNLSCESDLSLGLTYFIKEGDYEPRIQSGEVPCDICSEVQAVKFCQTCSVSYCETHIRQHYKIPKLQKHTLVDVTGGLGQKLCQHDYSPLEVFCRTDQMLICSQCAETNHKGHDTVFYDREQAGRQYYSLQERSSSCR